MTTEHYIDEESLSVAWAKVLRLACRPGKNEISPVTVSITGFDENGIVLETPQIRRAIDTILASNGKQTVDTVAKTIFPHTQWNPAAARDQLYTRYKSILSKLRQHKGNNKGLYFERMITGGPPGKENQLEHAISTYIARPAVRRSALQVATFDPNRDHSTSALVGFPCLQHVTFAPADGKLSVNAFYASQYLVERGYGNYLGLCWLGRFVAHELGLALARLTCLVGVAKCDAAKGDVATVFSALDNATTSNKSTT